MPRIEIKTAAPTLIVNWEAYADFLDGSDLSEAEKREFIETMWSLVVGFVDLGFDVKSPAATCGKEQEHLPGDGETMVESIVSDWDRASKPKATSANGIKPPRRTP